MSSTTSPNMHLVIPTVGGQPGPDYADNVNSSLTLIDLHDHSPGNGVQITTDGININAAFSVNSNNITDIRSSRYTAQGAALALPTDLGAVYVAGADLYYNDTAGNQVRLTQGGSIVGTAGSITGLPSGTASAAYAAGTFVWQASTATAADMDFGSAILRNNTASSKGLTLSPPNAMAADYSLVLPAVPLATSVMVLSSAGNMSTITYPLLPASLATSATAGTNMQEFTSSGNFTVPTNVFAVYGVIWGGGGGGGGGVLNTAGGGGAAGGVKWEGWLSCTPADVIAVTVGAAGVGGTSGNNGADGGASLFGTFSVPGGPGGRSPGNGSAGGTYAALGVLSAYGGQGATFGGSGTVGLGTFYAATGTVGLNSGGSGGAGWTDTAAGGTGSSVGGGNGGGTNSGAGGGGGGCASNSTGGTGSAGRVTLYWASLP